MKHINKGKYGQVSQHTEIQASRRDSYVSLLKNASRALNIQSSSDLDEQSTQSDSLSLFKRNGTVIPNRSLIIKGQKRPWTVGNYLLAVKKAPSQVKLSIGYVISPDVS